MRKRQDNRGSTMIIVIVVIAFISILIGTILIVSTVNIQMKAVDRKAKDNFYSAEEALDQINLGLQKEMSVAANEAYAVVVKQFANKQMEVERRAIFNEAYLDNLESALVNVATPEHDYDPNILMGYLSTDIGGRTVIDSESFAIERDTDPNPKFLVLKGLEITYTDSEGYQSVIETDIRLSAPNLNLVQPTEMPDIFQYSIIANQQLVGSLSGAGVNFGGNIYAGSGGIKTDFGTHWKFNDVDRLVVNGDIEVLNTSSITATSDMEIWARDLLVKGGELTTMGQTFVASDLIISEEDSKVKIEGEYYGFGNGEELKEDFGNVDTSDDVIIALPGDSSSISINGKNTTLDMSLITNLFLAGSAEIATKDMDPGKLNIKLGEALEVKSNQIAYLVPPECIGVKNGEALYGRNPISYADYEKMLQEENNDNDAVPEQDFQMVSFDTQLPGLNKTLDDYREAGTKGYQEVFIQNKMVYFYVNFTADNAAQYFRDYYDKHGATLNAYMDPYVDEVLLNNHFSRIVKGNLIHSNADALVYYDDYDAALPANEIQDRREQSENYQKRFRALCKKLVLDYTKLSPEELSDAKDVFSNLVLDNAFDNVTFGTTGTLHESTGAGNVVKARIINNEGGAAYHYTGEAGVCLILANGDVVLDADFSGMVLAKGTVTISNDKVNYISGNQDDLHKILKTRIDPADPASKTVLAQYFVDGDLYTLDNTSGAVSNADGYVNYKDFIAYEGWTKR